MIFDSERTSRLVQVYIESNEVTCLPSDRLRNPSADLYVPSITTLLFTLFCINLHVSFASAVSIHREFISKHRTLTDGKR
jgi:hypothetical protein